MVVCISVCSWSACTGCHSQRGQSEWGSTDAGIASVDSLQEFRSQEPEIPGWTIEVPDTLDIRRDSGGRFYLNHAERPVDDLSESMETLFLTWLSRRNTLPQRIYLHYDDDISRPLRGTVEDTLRAVQDSIRYRIVGKPFKEVGKEKRDSIKKQYPVLFQGFN